MLANCKTYNSYFIENQTAQILLETANEYCYIVSQILNNIPFGNTNWENEAFIWLLVLTKIQTGKHPM